GDPAAVGGGAGGGDLVGDREGVVAQLLYELEGHRLAGAEGWWVAEELGGVLTAFGDEEEAPVGEDVHGLDIAGAIGETDREVLGRGGDGVVGGRFGDTVDAGADLSEAVVPRVGDVDTFACGTG